MNRFSADFFYVSGGTQSYFGSFRVDARAITTTATEVRLEGLGTFTWAAGAPFVRVTIPRVTIFEPAAPATVQFITPPSSLGATYSCAFASPYFRSVLWEQDCVAGAVPFVSYDTEPARQAGREPLRRPRRLGRVPARGDRGPAVRHAERDPGRGGRRGRQVDRRRAARSHGRQLLAVGECAAVEGLAARGDRARRRLPRDHVRLHGHAPATGVRRLLQRDRGLGSVRPARAAAHLRARDRARVQPAALVAEEPRGPAAAARRQQRVRRPVVDELHLELPAVVRARGRRRLLGGVPVPVHRQ